MAVPPRQPIVRQIYFYQMSDIIDLWHNPSTMPKFSPSLLTTDLKALRGDARYLHISDEYDLCLLSDGNDAFQFGKTRKTDMARVEINGMVRPLILGHGEKLFDCIHLVFFPGGLVGAEFNVVGPKMTALTDYLVSRLTSCTPVTFDRLVHRDVMERLSRLQEIKLIEMRIDAARSEVLAPFGNGWIETANWMDKELGVGSIEIALRAGPTAHRSLRQNVISAVREVFSTSNLRDATDKFKIRAVLNGSEAVIDMDLLNDKLMTSVDIPRNIYRNPSQYKEFIYREIRKAYNTLKQDIMQAARVIT